MTDQDDLPPEYSDIPRDELKHGTGRYKDVILVPQPSDDPNDPLNVSVPIRISPKPKRERKLEELFVR
jgi:hypothetical protein